MQIISHYPPEHTTNLKQFETKPSTRICGPIFTSETIRLEGSGVSASATNDLYGSVHGLTHNSLRRDGVSSTTTRLSWIPQGSCSLFAMIINQRPNLRFYHASDLSSFLSSVTLRFSPVIGAGYFVGHSSFLQEVPFDPFLPWIFMGEEIIMSSRLWTSGYDMFSPAQAVVGHIYFRRHQPKFWESVHRTFTMGVHNMLEVGRP
jgi:Glycosyltransferase (GlcNAc)